MERHKHNYQLLRDELGRLETSKYRTPHNKCHRNLSLFLYWLGSIKTNQKNYSSKAQCKQVIPCTNGRFELFTHNWTKHLWSVHSFQGMLGPV